MLSHDARRVLKRCSTVACAGVLAMAGSMMGAEKAHATDAWVKDAATGAAVQVGLRALTSIFKGKAPTGQEVIEDVAWGAGAGVAGGAVKGSNDRVGAVIASGGVYAGREIYEGMNQDQGAGQNQGQGNQQANQQGGQGQAPVITVPGTANSIGQERTTRARTGRGSH